MKLDRHSVKYGDPVWALIEGIPKQVLFRGLLPYRGFAFELDGSMSETTAEATFADTLESLVFTHIAEHRKAIRQIEQQIERLEFHLKEPTAPTPQATGE